MFLENTPSPWPVNMVEQLETLVTKPSTVKIILVEPSATSLSYIQRHVSSLETPNGGLGIKPKLHEDDLDRVDSTTRNGLSIDVQ